VIARARIVAEADGSGGTRLVVLRSSVPLVLRQAQGAVWIVGGAAGPLGGDDLSLDVDVGPGATLTVRTAAAAVALPGPAGSASRLRVSTAVGAGATLRWLPEPVVAASGCLHRADARIGLGGGARLVWREEVLLGRHGEDAGSCRSRIRVDLQGNPLLRQEVRVGPDALGWRGAAVAAGARAIGSLLVVDPALEGRVVPGIVLGPTAVAVSLAGPAALVTALAPGALSLRALLAEGETRLQVWTKEPKVR
jgi:urease accessory protein